MKISIVLALSVHLGWPCLFVVESSNAFVYNSVSYFCLCRNVCRISAAVFCPTNEFDRKNLRCSLSLCSAAISSSEKKSASIRLRLGRVLWKWNDFFYWQLLFGCVCVFENILYFLWKLTKSNSQVHCTKQALSHWMYWCNVVLEFLSTVVACDYQYRFHQP